MDIGVIAIALEEEDHNEMVLALSVQRKMLRSQSVLDLPNYNFFKLYRMPKDVFMEVFNEVEDLLAMGSRSTRIDPLVRFAVTISFYATGGYQTNVCQDRLSQTTAGECIEEVTIALASRLPRKWIRFPMTAAARNRIKKQFMDKYGVPGIVGCIDCTHVNIIAPRDSENIYVDRRQKHSLNVQLVCDNDLRILSVDATHPGSSHDSSIWRTSADRHVLKSLHEENNTENSWVLGDNGYPLEPWLITQFGRPVEGSPEDKFNELHRTMRNCIERVNGVLKMRWRCLLGERTLRYEPEKVVKFTNVCCALHNLCIERGVIAQRNRAAAARIRAEAIENNVHGGAAIDDLDVELGNRGGRNRPLTLFQRGAQTRLRLLAIIPQ